MSDANNDSFNAVNNGSTNSEFFDDTDFPPLKSPQTPSTVDFDRLNSRIAELEKEKSESESRVAGLKFELEKLRSEKNSESASRIGEVKSELEKLRSEKDAELEKLRSELKTESERAESSDKAAEMLAKRAGELEIEVSRLQHDFITASNDLSEANREIPKLNTEIAELKREKSEVEGKVKLMEQKMEELVKKSDESDKLIGGFMQKIADREIEIESEAIESEAVEDSEDNASGVDHGEEVWKQLKENLPLIGAVSVSAGVVLAGGVMCYIRYSRN